jgi:hypothetical protein
MERILIDLLAGGEFNDPAKVHDRHPLADVVHHAEIM